MKKLESLTQEQKDKIPEWVSKWVGIGLSTEPADFESATSAALRAYQLCNLDKPMVVLRMSSPYAATLGGIYAWMLLKSLKEAPLKSKVGDQVMAQVRGQVGAQVMAQVGGQVMAQVGDQVWDQVGDQVRDQVGAQVMAQVRAQVRDQVGAQVMAQVRGQVGAQVRGQVGDQVRGQVGDQVWDQVGDQVRDQVGAQVMAQVRDQVGAQVMAQVRGQVGAQVRGQVGAQVMAQVGGQVMAQVKDGIYNDGISSMWCAFTSFASFFKDVCNIQLDERFEVNEALVKSCGWTWWHQNILAISDRPSKISRDVNGRLHCENGPSIEYRDGWSLYHWHGVSIPKEWVTGSKPSSQEALTWLNIEQRRAACEIVGWASIMSELNAVTIDEDGDPEIGTLLEADIPDSGKERFLQVRCGTGRVFALPVPRDVNTAIEANAWTYGLDVKDFQPEVRT